MKSIDNPETSFIDINRMAIDGIVAVLIKPLEFLILGGFCNFLKNIDFCHFVIL